MSDITDSSVVIAAEDHLATELDGETVILHLSSATYFGLNDVGTRIWNLVQEPRTVADIREQIVDEYDVEPDRCDRDLRNLLRELNEMDLVTITERPTSDHMST